MPVISNSVSSLYSESQKLIQIPVPVPCASKLRCHCQLLPLTANMVVPTIAVDHQPMMGSARLLHMLLESAQLVHLLMACIIQSTSMCSIVSKSTKHTG